MKVLGAVLAGGQSRRFGSDKAAALVGGRPLIRRAIEAVADQCEGWVICGRASIDGVWLADRPCGSLGPLGGLNAALHYGASHGFDAVLCLPCDVPDIPSDLRDRLQAPGGPTYLAILPVIGLWPCVLAATLDRFLEDSSRHSLKAWAAHVGATAIALPRPVSNINTPDDLTAYESR